MNGVGTKRFVTIRERNHFIDRLGNDSETDHNKWRKLWINLDFLGPEPSRNLLVS